MPKLRLRPSTYAKMAPFALGVLEDKTPSLDGLITLDLDHPTFTRLAKLRFPGETDDHLLNRILSLITSRGSN